MIGESFGNYRVVKKLGQGGMGVVYLAEHALLGKKAVIKQLLPELSQNAEIVQRFFNEARAATLIRHPGIVDVFDFGQHPSGSAFIVMEFLDGESLAGRLERERPLPPALTAAIGRQIASAVGAAHAVGIVHRDLKPDNVYLVPDREAPAGLRVKVLDFGIAKLAGDAKGGLKTRTGAVMGTPVYMSPEQCHGAAELDHRADIYSLGCILFELVCARPPFVGEGLGEIIGAHMFQAPPRPRDLSPWVPPDLEGLILAMLEKAPGARPQSMEIVMQALDAIGAASGGFAIASGAYAPVSGGYQAAGGSSPPPSSRAPLATPVAPRYPTPVASAPPGYAVPHTTLGAAASEVARSSSGATLPTPGRSRGAMIAIGGAGVAAAATVGILLALRGGAKSTASIDAGAGAAPHGMIDPIGACTRGTLDACVPAARSKLIASSWSPREAAQLLERGCTGNDAAACGWLAQLLLAGEDGVPADASRAVSLATRGCNHKDGASCVALAIAQRDGTGIAADLAAAITSATTACDAGLGTGCAIAADGIALTGDASAAGVLGGRAQPLLARACDDGEPLACNQLAELYVRGRGVARDLAKAVTLLQAACDGVSSRACLRLAGMYTLGQGVRPDPVRARELRKRAAKTLAPECDAGQPGACGALGTILATDTGTTRDPVRASAMLATACDGNDGDACLVLAGMHASGDGVPRSPAQAGELYRRAVTQLQRECETADAGACVRAAKILATGRGVQADPARAAALDARICRAGFREGCVGWGTADPDAATDAYGRALALAEPACTDGDLSGCDLAGDVLCLGPTAMHDAARCNDFYRRACDGGLGEGCSDLAWATTQGPTADVAAAEKLYLRACDQGFGPACGNVAKMRFDAKDLAGARRYLEQACDDGDAPSCASYAEALADGMLGAKDPSHARELAARACVLGATSACD